MSIHSVAVALTIVLLVYHQVTTWAPLYPWNDVEKYTRKELLLEASINGLLMGAGAICVAVGNSGFAHYYPLAYYPIILVGECVDWWIPYFSPAFAKARKVWDYDAHFARTVKIIPHSPGKRTPDANHIVLHALTVVTAAAVFWDRLA